MLPLLPIVLFACANAPDGAWGDGSLDPSGDEEPDLSAIASEHCFDEVDNDGDGATDCDDDECTYDPACSTCGIQVSGTCSTSWQVFTTRPESAVSGYSCGGGGDGFEVVYEFSVLEDTTVTVRADPDDGTFGFGSADVSLYVLEGTCHPDLCIGFAEDRGAGGVETVTFEARAYTWYYLVVEEKVAGDFVLSTDCL